MSAASAYSSKRRVIFLNFLGGPLFFFGGADHSDESVAKEDYDSGKDHDVSEEDPEDGGAILKELVADIDEAAPADNADEGEYDHGEFFLLGSHLSPV